VNFFRFLDDEPDVVVVAVNWSKALLEKDLVNALRFDVSKDCSLAALSLDSVAAAIGAVVAIEEWAAGSCKKGDFTVPLKEVSKVKQWASLDTTFKDGAPFWAEAKKATKKDEKFRPLATELRLLLDELADDATQFEAALKELADDMKKSTDFKIICQANDWKWDWVVRVKRLGIPFSLVIDVPSLKVDGDGMRGGKMTAAHRVDFGTLKVGGKAVGVRIFKPNELRTKSVTMSPWMNSVARVISTKRMEDLIWSEVPEKDRLQSLVGDANVAIVDVNGTRVLGTAVTFWTGFEPLVGSKSAEHASSSTSPIDKTPVGETGFGKVASLVSTTPHLNPDDADLRRQFNVLELFDILCAQLDRNLGNMMVQRAGIEATRSRVVGIDSDFSFPYKFDALTHTDLGVVTGRPLLRSPKVLMDKVFVEAAVKVIDPEIETALKGLTQSEIACTKSRFKAFKELAANSEKATLVSDWAKVNVTDLQFVLPVSLELTVKSAAASAVWADTASKGVVKPKAAIRFGDKWAVLISTNFNPDPKKGPATNCALYLTAHTKDGSDLAPFLAK
jgi:hypothetical protein